MVILTLTKEDLCLETLLCIDCMKFFGDSSCNYEFAGAKVTKENYDAIYDWLTEEGLTHLFDFDFRYVLRKDRRTRCSYTSEMPFICRDCDSDVPTCGLNYVECPDCFDVYNSINFGSLYIESPPDHICSWDGLQDFLDRCKEDERDIDRDYKIDIMLQTFTNEFASGA